MANTCGKSLTQESERRLVESLRAGRLRLFDTPTADLLRRLFGERRLVNGAPQRRAETTGRDFESDRQEAELGTNLPQPLSSAIQPRCGKIQSAPSQVFPRCNRAFALPLSFGIAGKGFFQSFNQ